MIIDVPFLRIGCDTPYQPFLFIRVTNPDNDFSDTMLALVDTGAEDCCLPGTIAKKLGHDLTNVQGKSILGVSGSCTAYPHTSIIDVLSVSGTYEKPALSHDVVLSLGPRCFDFVEGLSIAILGVSSFLKDYILTIDYPAKKFSVLSPK